MGLVLKYGISMIVYIGILMLIVEVMRKNYRFSSWFWAATLLTFPLWIMTGGVSGWFRWVKILSVILPTIVLGFARVANADNKTGGVWSFLRKNWMLWFLYGILFLNITEATIKDLQMGNFYNALAGIVLCITIPYAPKYWDIENKNNGDLLVYVVNPKSWTIYGVEKSTPFSLSHAVIFRRKLTGLNPPNFIFIRLLL